MCCWHSRMRSPLGRFTTRASRILGNFSPAGNLMSTTGPMIWATFPTISAIANSLNFRARKYSLNWIEKNYWGKVLGSIGCDWICRRNSRPPPFIAHSWLKCVETTRPSPYSKCPFKGRELDSAVPVFNARNESFLRPVFFARCYWTIEARSLSSLFNSSITKGLTLISKSMRFAFHSNCWIPRQAFWSFCFFGFHFANDWLLYTCWSSSIISYHLIPMWFIKWANVWEIIQW